MKLLAIETATEACSAALWVDGQTTQRFRIAPREHAALILSMCDELLADAGVARAELDAVAFGRGPGSFTGVRIAASAAQGMAFALERPVLPISTLAALAQGARRERGWERVLAAIDARMGEVYWATFSADARGLMVPNGEEAVAAPARVTRNAPGAVQGAGSGWQTYGAILSQATGITEWDGDRLPQARDVAELAVAAWARGEAVPPEQAIPVYIRDDVAHKKA
jgi:tRNA threonylcarbamoyladenosine biosynthesis protein TsaB